MNDTFRRTKIIATLGPASSEPEVLRSLIEAGVDIFRLNFSHGSHEEKRDVIAAIRQVSDECKRPVAILQDLQGPKIRVGPLRVPELRLVDKQRILIYGDDRLGDDKAISVGYEDLPRDVKTGDP